MEDNFLDEMSGITKGQPASDNFLDEMSGISAQPQESTFMSRARERFSKVPTGFGDIVSGKTPYIAGGMLVGTAMDAAFTGAGKVLGAVTPDFIQENLKYAGREFLKSPITRATIESAKYWRNKLEENTTPDQRAFLEATGNYAMAVPMGAFAKKPITEAVNVARDVAASGMPIEQQITNAVKHGIEKGIRPTVVGKSTDPQMKLYMDRAEEAVKTIVSNRDNLVLTDKAGNRIKGALPRSLQQFSEAIDQTKRGIFRQYDDMAKAAGETGAVVDLNPIAKEIQRIAADPTTKDLFPGLAKHADDLATSLSERGFYTAEQAQDAIAKLNNSLKAFYKNPSYENASRAGIDALLVNNLRKGLDDTIERAVGEGYQGLKKTYGSLKNIEKEVAHRATVDARKNPKGLIDFTDIFTAGELLAGLTTMSPAMITRATVMKGAKEYIKKLNDPNFIVKSMFGDVEKLLNKSNVPRSRTVGSMAAMNPMAPEATPSMKPPPYFRVERNLPSTDVRSGVTVGIPKGYSELPAPPLKGLPPGQGFELGASYGDDIIDVPFTARTRPQLNAPRREPTLELPGGQGFTLVDKPKTPPKPPENIPPPKPPDDSFGSGTRAARERMRQREIAQSREKENLVTQIQEMGGIKWTKDYNPKILKQNPDLKRTLNNTRGKSPDEIADELRSMGWPIEEGDDIIEILKSGKGRTIYNPVHEDRLMNRKMKKLEDEFVREELEKLQMDEVKGIRAYKQQAK